MKDKYEKNTGYIKEKNSSCIIALGKIFASKGNVVTTNKVIEEIAEKYDLVVVDFSDMHQNIHPEWHSGVSNPHFGKAGNIHGKTNYKNRFIGGGKQKLRGIINIYEFHDTEGIVNTFLL